MLTVSQWFNRMDTYQYTPWFMVFINGHIHTIYFSLPTEYIHIDIHLSLWSL